MAKEADMDRACVTYGGEKGKQDFGEET